MKDNKKEKKPKKLPNSVIEHYAPYRRKNNKLKTFLVMGTRFDLEERYEIIDSVGQGAYGIVVAARDKTIDDPEEALIAIKKVEKAFEHKIFTKRTLRELKILRLMDHENVINIEKIMLPKSREEFEDIYIFNELMETDLASIIKSPQALSDEHLQFFVYQILRGLKYIHSAGVIHRDLKPRNLLVNGNCDLKICDFGLARRVQIKERTKSLTGYVATRWYRAPELLLSASEYGPEVDMWSVGCIFAELLKRKPFLPGTDTKNQLQLIVDVFGSLSESQIASIKKEKFKKLLRSLPIKKPKSLDKVFPDASQLALDLLSKMLVFDPKKRITAAQALEHPYLAALHFPDDEPETSLISENEFDFENHSLSAEQLKDLIYEEILLYHYDDFFKAYKQKVTDGKSPIEWVLNNENAHKPGEESSDGDEDDD